MLTSDDNRALESFQDEPPTEQELAELTSGVEYFDRERWHDVESDEEPGNEAETRSLNSEFAAAILLLMAVLTGATGLLAAHLIPMVNTDIPAIPRDYTNTPALWVRYTENSVFLCDVSDPRCFAASRNGTIFLGNASPPSVHIYSVQGNPETVWPLDFVPQAIAWGEPGQAFAEKLLVAFHDRIGVYSQAGMLEKVLFLTAQSEPNEPSSERPNEKWNVASLAIDGNAVFAADSGNRLIYRFTEESDIPAIFGEPVPDGFGGLVVFQAPVSLTVSQKTGLLHVANPGQHRIETFTPEGHWESSLSWQSNSAGVTGFAGCCNPVGLDTLADGRIVTVEKDIMRVKIYRPDGRLDCVVAGPEILGRKPQSIPQLAAITPSSEDEKRTVFVAALENGNVLVFDPLWRIVRLFSPDRSEKIF